MQIFRTPDDILEFAVASFGKEFKIGDFEISDDFNIQITIDGDTWDGLIDYRVARYILELQHDIFTIYNNTFNTNLSLRSSLEDVKGLLIKASVDKGCTKIWVLLKETINNKVSVMTGPQRLLFLALVAALTTGYLAFKDYNHRLIEISKNTQDAQTKREIFELGGKALVVAEKSTSALRYIASQAKVQDSIEFTAFGKTVEKDKIQDILPQERKRTEQAYRVDGQYKLLSINIEKQESTIRQGGKSFSVSTKLLPVPDKTRLHDEGAKADLGDYVPELDLQVSIVVVDGAISEGYIHGFGPKREHTVQLSDVLRPKPIRPQASQANLPGLP
jgi:hypothetical protein